MEADPIFSPQAHSEHPLRDLFQRFSVASSNLTGSPAAFIVSLILVVVWAATGPYLHYSDSWQLIINTISSVAAFLMVFIIQNSQTRDTMEIHLKLDELIRAAATARNQFMDLEQLSEEQLERITESFRREAQRRQPSER